MATATEAARLAVPEHRDDAFTAGSFGTSEAVALAVGLSLTAG